MHPTPHVMVDLETLSSDSNAAIVSIGAVAFNPETGTIGATFQRTIKPRAFANKGGKDGA